jgi:anti-repressor protein
MNQLIKISENNGNKAVSARELHEFLIKDAKGGQIGEDFSHWIERKLEYDYEYGIDYTTIEYDYLGNEINSESENQDVRVHKRDYILTMDTAKEMAMTQNNDKGKQARRYFIAIEKKATQSKALATKQERQLQHYALIDAIKQNLVRGDVVDVANECGFSRKTCENVMRGRTYNPAIIKALFDRAIFNKKIIGQNTQEMINQLTH